MDDHRRTTTRRVYSRAGGRGSLHGTGTTVDGVVGQVGEVITRIRGAAGPGEVRVLVDGCVEHLIAYSDVHIDRGTEVLVLAYREASSVDVVPWPLTTTGSLP